MNDRSGVTPVGRRSQPRPSQLYPVLWRFAAERQRIYLLRVAGEIGPWTDDPARLRAGSPIYSAAYIMPSGGRRGVASPSIVYTSA